MSDYNYYNYYNTQRSMDRAQRAYDAQLPPEDDKGIECPICEGSGTIKYEENGEPVTNRCGKCNGEGVVDE